MKHADRVMKLARKALEKRFGAAPTVSFHWLTYGSCVIATDSYTGSWVKFYLPEGALRGKILDEYRSMQ
jgi:hypothetical protein